MRDFEKLSVQKIKKYLQEEAITEDALSLLLKDQRVSVQNLARKFQKDQIRFQKEQSRIQSLYHYEEIYYKQGYTLIAGLDEVGRGPLAGPVVTAGVILPPYCFIEGLNDSKKLSPEKREKIFVQITEQALAYTWHISSAQEIDEVNIYQATLNSMSQCVQKLEPQALLLDAVKLADCPQPQVSLIKGDSLSASIAAASIIAKVTRDHLMLEYDKIYPDYGFSRHKGYGTADHLAVLKKIGPCPLHRKSFEPIKSGVF